MIYIHIFDTKVVYQYDAGVIWIDRIDDYGIDSMFKVNDEFAYYFFGKPREFLTLRYEVYYFNA